VLEEPVVGQLLSILRYLDKERKKVFDGEELLFELMHSPFFGIRPTDIAHFALYVQGKKAEKASFRWKLALDNGLLFESLGLSSAKEMMRLGNCLDDWEQQQTVLSLVRLLEKIVYEGGVVNYMLQHTDHVWNLQILRTFFEFVREVCYRNPRIDVAAFLQMVDRMNVEKLSVPAERVIQSEHGVYFYTAHSAKGNEFEHVFLIGCTKNFWEEKRGGNNEFKMPDTITETIDDPESTYKTEVARRLFYVAVTRAKKHLYLSYAEHDNAGKSLTASRFIDEVSEAGARHHCQVPATDILEQLKLSLEPVKEARIKLANGEWIDKALQQFTMSYTTLSKYLRCPLTFYYENILRVPFQRSDALGFGSAVHTALERLFLDMKARKGTFPDKAQFMEYFEKAMYRESPAFTSLQFDRRMEQGRTILDAYYDHIVPGFRMEVGLEIELQVPRYILAGVPVTGKLDRVEIDADHCTVVDYKTGDPEKAVAGKLSQPSEKDPQGGDYWRQAVFYKLLIENYKDRNWKVDASYFDFVQPTKAGDFKRVYIPVHKQDEEVVLGQLTDTYARIMNHEFSQGCGKEDCHWCNFTKRYEIPSGELE
jgi:DNA helicase II / ATP-dependent DNA helicase PcrA